ncbi:hypothetical protein [Streptomyces sp. NBC_01601]|uniref:hypothetical protein n=1 Tax=Streptomyces sp. NBC_01601 TaxID=2975892 RepID=UPI002E2A698A|nr:hypothetical protein [Streptomyces sp. NBC_01601]
MLTQDQAVETARGFRETGPVGELAAGQPPSCFARLRLRLGDLLAESRGTEAALGMVDGPDDVLMERGKEEMAEITRELAALHAWAGEQQCAPESCECRADRLLRRRLTEAGLPEQTGYSPASHRPVCVMAGYPDPRDDGSMVYVVIDHRNSIDHAVLVHRGWRARLVTRTGSQAAADGQLAYESSGYPHTAVVDYRADTRACVDAVRAALRLADSRFRNGDDEC